MTPPSRSSTSRRRANLQLLRSPSNTVHREHTGPSTVRSPSKHLAGGHGRARAVRLRRIDRYAIPLVAADGGWREAADGDGAWRALAVAIAEGRTIPALAADGPARPGRDQARDRSMPRCLPAVARFRGLGAKNPLPCGRRRGPPRPGPVEHVGRARRAAAAQGVPPHPAGSQPGSRADRVPDRGGGLRRGAAPRGLGRGRDPRQRRGDRRDAPGVRRPRRRCVRACRRVPHRARRFARVREPGLGDRGRR